MSILNDLGESELNSKEIIKRSDFPKTTVLEAIQRLLDDNKIKLTSRNTYTKNT
jgi:predicted transcriptional regulator